MASRAAFRLMLAVLQVQVLADLINFWQATASFYGCNGHLIDAARCRMLSVRCRGREATSTAVASMQTPCITSR